MIFFDVMIFLYESVHDFSRDLAAFDKSHNQAIHTYQEHRASMHPVTAMLVGKDLKVD